jgi:hypothetical protein
VGEIDLELPPDRVADPTLERAERLLLRLALSDLAVVVDAAGSVVRDLSYCDEVYRVVEFAVAAGVEPVPLSRSARCLDRRGPVVGGEAFLGREASRVADVSEDQPRDDRADAIQLEQVGLRRGDGVTDPGLDSDELTVESAEVGEEFAGEPLSFEGDQPSECAPRSSFAARSALKRKGAPPATSSRISAWSRHAACVRNATRSS